MAVFYLHSLWFPREDNKLPFLSVLIDIIFVKYCMHTATAFLKRETNHEN
jgi:hypothetical protein